MTRQRRMEIYLHISDSYPLGVAPGRGPSGRPRKSPAGAVSREGVVYDCPACVAGRHKFHPAHTRNGAPRSPCRCYHYGPGTWSCEVCLGTRPAVGPAHVVEE